MAPTITIPAEFRRQFDAEAKTTLAIVNDCEFSSEERSEAEALLSAIQLCPGAVGLTVPATSAALVTISGCIIAEGQELPTEGICNDPKVRQQAEAAMDRLRRWYAVAAEVPEEVRA